MSSLDNVVGIAVHPAIGIARVGNSRREFVFAPEIPGSHSFEGVAMRDTEGAFKRQAARFRLYGFDAGGHVIREITAADGKIIWRVHLANKKAAWYDFQQALDIPASKGELPGLRPLASALRNKDVSGAERAQLIIDPGPRTIASAAPGEGAAEETVRFDTGTFLGNRVDLGEARVDAAGALTVLGGFGQSSSPKGAPLIDFANNPGWHDDVSDGPVDAVVEIDGRRFEAIGAWVIVGPPNFAPGVPPIITGWDVVLEVMIRKGLAPKPQRTSFAQHVQPLLERLSAAQWVNSGFALQFGWGSPADMLDEVILARLADPGETTRPLRQAVFAWFRNSDYLNLQADRLPGIYGDAILINPNTEDPREWMAVLETQYEHLQRWAQGDFEPQRRSAPPLWEDLSPAQRAAALDQAALEDCNGGPFHPGIEFTWPLRQPILFDDTHPFRIKRRLQAEAALPPEITSSVALATGGPLDGSLAGDITRWMAVPWQGDTASCLSAYEDYVGEYLPTFWPARVPNDVITEKSYQTIMNRSTPSAEREAAFAVSRRRKWLRGFSYRDNDVPKPAMLPGVEGIQRFTSAWHQAGLIVGHPGPPDLATLPRQMWVETGRSVPAAEPLGMARHSGEPSISHEAGPFRSRRISRLAR